MGAIQKGNWETYPDNLTQDFLIPYAFANVGIAVEACDAMYFKGQVAGGDVAYPADQFPTGGTEAIDQFNFARLFVGMSQNKILLGETNAFKRFVVRTEGVMSAPCPSQTWKHGDFVGIFSNGITLDPQQVDKVTNQGAAIGICIREQPAASSRVIFRFQSRFSGNLLDSLQGGSLFDLQTINAASVLTDANQTFTVASPFFSTMTNSGPRNLVLPLETASKGLAFFHANLLASTSSNTFKSSANGNIVGNGVVPAGKTGFVFCDGVSWYGNISA